ncbi:MAG: gamma-glutamylcyclotransferase family protein [Acidobacteriota bacterium]
MAEIDANTELASDFTVARYRSLLQSLNARDSQDWDEVYSAFRRRFRERFFAPIHHLTQLYKCDELPCRPGIAILALDCLLIDAIQSFREGRVGTGELSPAKSFKTFLRSKRFGDFRSQDRDDFFSDIRNGILHNGETRKDWKVRIDTKGMLDRVAGTRILNPRRFHAAIIREWRDLDRALRSADSDARTKFLQRMNAIAGLIAQPKFYFAYGSNLRDEECRRSAPHAEAHSRAFLPNFRLVFEKHSHTRGGDAATIIPDPTRVVWGFLYRVTDQDLKGLVAREAGYTCCEKLVYVPGGRIRLQL